MTELLKADLCVIGAGSGGLSAAAGAAQMGADTVLFERALMGGDCLNHGCVPSKALLAAAKTAGRMRSGSRFGVSAAGVSVDFQAVHDHVHGVIAAIAPNDSVERFEGLGVRVIQAPARFIDRRTVEGGGWRVRARRFVIATGSSPAVPPIPGLRDGPYLTNETLFARTAAPEHLIVIGGGPIGMEMAQAHRRLGARVTVLEMATILGPADPELARLLREGLTGEGIEIHEGTAVQRVEHEDGRVRVTVSGPDGPAAIEGSDILVAAGRRPNLDTLDLAAAGIAHDRTGIAVDDRLRSSNRRVFAIGDVAGGPQFTHIAGYHAGIVLRNALFRLPARVDRRAVPWVIFTDPELAHVGLSEAEARAAGEPVRILRWPFAENDRAQAERATAGLVKLVVGRRGRVLGASILGAGAGELIQTWCLAIAQRLPLGAVASLIAPYPTLGEINKRVAGSWFTPRLFGEGTRRVVRLLSRLG